MLALPGVETILRLFSSNGNRLFRRKVVYEVKPSRMSCGQQYCKVLSALSIMCVQTDKLRILALQDVVSGFALKNQ
jgi:hypothetical protein